MIADGYYVDVALGTVIHVPLNYNIAPVASGVWVSQPNRRDDTRKKFLDLLRRPSDEKTLPQDLIKIDSRKKRVGSQTVEQVVARGA